MRLPTPRPSGPAGLLALVLLTAQSPAIPARAGGDDAPAAAPVMVGGPFEVEPVHDVPYVEGPDADPKKHRLDLYVPKGVKDAPVLFFIHGGGWRSGDRRLYGALGRVFARNGLVAVIPSYRLTPQVQHPGHIEDVARAFAWTHANVARHGGRADRVFVSGQSAGGHLAALLATNPTYLRAVKLTPAAIRGVVPISGVYTFAPGRMEVILGKGPEANASASPLKHVSGDEPPFLILHADRDFPGCGAMSRALNAALERAKVETSCVEIPDRNHISIVVRMMLDVSDPTDQAVLGFIARHSELKLTPRAAD